MAGSFRTDRRPPQPPSQLADIRARFAAAVRHYETGRTADAFQLCQQVLALDPGHLDALQLTGVLALQIGKTEIAIDALGRAVARNGNVPDLHNTLGEALRIAGRLDEAVAHFHRSIALAPNFAEAYGNLANALGQQEKHEEAVAAGRRAVTLAPNEAMLHYNLGNVFAAAKLLDDAIASFHRALALNPGYVEAYLNLGNAHRSHSQPREAAVCYQRALALKPDFAPAYRNLGALLIDLHRYGDAVAVLRRAVAVAPDSADIHMTLGNALRAAGQVVDAVAELDRALALEPDSTDVLALRAGIMLEQARNQEAVANFARLVAVDPDYDYAAGNLLYAKSLCCDWSDYEPAVERLASAVAAGQRVTPPLTMVGVLDSPADQLRAARIFSRDEAEGAGTRAVVLPRKRYAHERIRVAYLSADLRVHAVAYLMAGIFEAHDRSRFETIAISFLPSNDEMQRRLRPLFGRFIDVQDKSDDEVAQLVRQLEVDVAVDLMGYTQSMRAGILRRRPAPVQVQYLGFPATMGSDHIDYLIADRFVVPEAAQGSYAEKIAYLPECFLPNDAGRAVADRTPSRAECGLPEQGFVFCSFNNSYKFKPAVFDVWMRLLRQVEGSVLWLRQDTEVVIGNLRREAAARGIDPDRMVFAPRVPRVEDHLARYRVAGLFLDTLPYNAHTTAADALWTGLPVVTCSGASFAARVAGSLLHAVGLAELVTDTLDEYEALALRLARDETALAAIKAKLARNRDSFPLFDTERHCRHLERAYETMWARDQRGEPPESFAVAPLATRA